MTVRELISRLGTIKEELQDKEICVIAPNGITFEPAVKFRMKQEYVLQLDKEGVDKVILTYE